MFIRKEISVMSRKPIPFWSKCSNPTVEWADSVKSSWKSWQSCILDKLSSYPGMLLCEPCSGYYTNVILCWQCSLSTYSHVTSLAVIEMCDQCFLFSKIFLDKSINMDLEKMFKSICYVTGSMYNYKKKYCHSLFLVHQQKHGLANWS